MQLVSSLWESCLSTKNGLSLQCEMVDDPVADAVIPENDLETSMKEMSLQDDSDLSMGTSGFAPRWLVW